MNFYERKKGRPYLTALLALIAAVWLFGISFIAILLPPVTAALAENNVNDKLSPLSHQELVEIAKTGRDFVMGNPNAKLPEGTDERNSFPADAAKHMGDVRSVLFAVRIAVMILSALLVAAFIAVRSKAGPAALGKGLFAGGASAIGVALALTLFGLVNFDAFFTAIHGIFFEGESWIFADDSLIICVYPLGFWIGMGGVWAGTLALLSGGAMLAGKLLRRAGV